MNLSKVGVVTIRTRASLLAVAALIGLSLGLSGCKGDAGAAGGAASVQVATGTIQGLLRDSVTQQPIAGALVDIGVASATTNTQGVFVMTNVVVPVDANNNAKATTFPASINMRNVTSPVNMASTATPRYADFFHQNIPIAFTVLYPAAASSVATVPVTGLVATTELMVGKLAANITGVVADNVTKQPVAAGYTVKLVSLGPDSSASGPGGTGGAGNIVGSTVTDANGNFSFANIESLRAFRIDAWNAAQTFSGNANVTAPADGETKVLSVQANSAVFVSSTDILPPTIISVTPQQNSDIAITGGASVVYTFSEAIQQTVDTNVSPSVPTGLYATVAVNYMGSKASNISHSLSWNAAFTQLTVTIPTLAVASKYTVSLAGTGTTLKDMNNNPVPNADLGAAGKGVLSFTTNGSTTPAAPGTVTVTNSASLDFNSPTVLLNWMPVSGARAYNVYRAQNYPGAAGQLQKVVTGLNTVAGQLVSTLSSDYSDSVPNTPLVPFVSGQNQLTYSYVVTSVSADGIESATSTAVTAADTVKPTATIPAGLAATYTISFSEYMDVTSATTLSSYSLLSVAPPGVATTLAVNSAVYNNVLRTVTLTLATSTVAGNYLSISGVKDVAGNSMIAVTRTF